jgi:hypothetical protein
VRVAGLAAILLALAPGATAAPAPFESSIRAVRWAELRHSYRGGCPVGPADLRSVRLTHWGFDRRLHNGTLIVHRTVAGDVVAIFRRLYAQRFPIRRMVPVSAYRGSDHASMAADNTSSFNCRFVGGTRRWSMHAYGRAIDLNPRENPYVSGGRVSPPAGRAYLDRRRERPGVIAPGGAVVRAFASRGWEWGGVWSAPDYQHFSTTGR